MPDSDAPEGVTGNKEEEARQGKDGIPVFTPAEEEQQGIILDAGIGDEEGDDQQKAFSVDVKRIFSVFSRSVCKNVHEFQPLQGEKADGSVSAAGRTRPSHRGG